MAEMSVGPLLRLTINLDISNVGIGMVDKRVPTTDSCYISDQLIKSKQLIELYSTVPSYTLSRVLF